MVAALDGRFDGFQTKRVHWIRICLNSAYIVIIFSIYVWIFFLRRPSFQRWTVIRVSCCRERNNIACIVVHAVLVTSNCALEMSVNSERFTIRACFICRTFVDIYIWSNASVRFRAANCAQFDVFCHSNPISEMNKQKFQTLIVLNRYNTTQSSYFVEIFMLAYAVPWNVDTTLNGCFFPTILSCFRAVR